jgi:beta-glucanase (GH16 family)
MMSERRRLVWSDEFDGPAGSPPDPSSWSCQLGDGSTYGDPGWGNSELQCYTGDRDNVAQDGRGNLVITARSTAAGYSSARIVTKGNVEIRYGRIEARARVPQGAGVWAAIWALGADVDSAGWPGCGEIDIMEQVGRDPYKAFGTIHGPGYAGSEGVSGAVEMQAEFACDFHVFAVEWSRSAIEWSVDRHVYHRTAPDDVPGAWVFDHPFYLLMNLAVGGDLGGPVSATFPKQFLVDYIRVYMPAGISAEITAALGVDAHPHDDRSLQRRDRDLSHPGSTS